MARGVDRVAHTHVVAEVPVVVREVDERADYVQADDVGEAIEASELKLCGLDYTEDLVRLRHVRDMCDTADLRRNVFGPLRVDIDTQDPGAR